MEEWERVLREKLEVEIPEGIYSIVVMGKKMLTGREGVIDDLVEKERLRFDGQPNNCPDTITYPTGINQYEFIVNNSYQAGSPQESINISCVHGVNCVIRVNIKTNSAFNAGPTIPAVTSFANTMDRNEINIAGVYPYACTHCTDYIGAPGCIKLPQPVNTEQICQVQRPANQSGGLIKVLYLGQESIAKK